MATVRDGRWWFYGIGSGAAIAATVFCGVVRFVNPNLLSGGAFIHIIPFLLLFFLCAVAVFSFAYFGWRFLFLSSLAGLGGGTALMLLHFKRYGDQPWALLAGVLLFLTLLLSGVVLGVISQGFNFLNRALRAAHGERGPAEPGAISFAKVRGRKERTS